jgi:CheY-like chemotaxis protein
MTPRSILVVDDEPAVRVLYELVLVRRGHNVRTATTVAEALAACAAKPPDVVVVDMFMPEASGLELIRSLRRQSPSPRIIAVTGGGTWEGFEVLVTAKDAGADVTLRKPLPTEVLVEAVEGLFEPGT